MAADVLVKADVSPDHGWQMLTWAKQHCRSYITNSGVRHQDQWCYAFHFGSDVDATLFRLKFSEDLVYE